MMHFLRCAMWRGSSWTMHEDETGDAYFTCDHCRYRAEMR